MSERDEQIATALLHDTLSHQCPLCRQDMRSIYADFLEEHAETPFEHWEAEIQRESAAAIQRQVRDRHWNIDRCCPKHLKELKR